MLKRLCICLFCTVFMGTAGYFIYADKNGIFLEDDEQAKALIDEYITSVIKNYTEDGEQSFRGIVKQGCDFWYLNDYKTKNIAQSHSKGSGSEVEAADYSINYNSIDYDNKKYTIEATVTKVLRYRNTLETDTTVTRHIFTIEQDGNEMYIVDDKQCSEFTLTETRDTP